MELLHTTGFVDGPNSDWGLCVGHGHESKVPVLA